MRDKFTLPVFIAYLRSDTIYQNLVILIVMMDAQVTNVILNLYRWYLSFLFAKFTFDDNG